MKKINVSLKDRSYQILIGDKVLAELPKFIKKNLAKHSVHILTNTTVQELHQNKISQLFAGAGIKIEWIVIPDGEKHKNLQTIESIYTQLLKQGATRKSLLIALGGGVVGDICGFAAATFMRGIPFIQVPTTLLSQVDSSVGGKTGVDLPEGKNLIGAFYQPKLVLIDLLFLKTLPKREFLCGLSEVIKYGILWDNQFFEFLEKNKTKILEQNAAIITQIIARSCQIKAEIVSLDEREQNLRALLNLGHTVGHAIETLSGYSSILHGEGVAMGMSYAARLSNALGHLSVDDCERIYKLIASFGLPTQWPSYSAAKFTEAIAKDKKSLGQKINYVAIKNIGKTFLIPLSPEQILSYI